MTEKNDLLQIKKCIENSVGSKVRLLSDKGKRKSIVREGIIENSYPNIFTVRFENEFDTTRRVSFSYTDVLTKAIELVICRESKNSQVI